MTDRVLSFDIEGLKAHQRNRHPLLFLDRVVEAVPGRSVRAIKCFSYGEWFFPAHFDDDPNVPGFIQVECLAQAFIMTFLCMDEYKGMKTSFVGINNARFKRKIVPGDVLRIDATLTSLRRGLAQGRAESHVDGVAACSADFVVALPAVFERFTPRPPTAGRE